MKELAFNPNCRILVVAPHPDDETIGCGGLLLKYGNQVDVLVITDGRGGVEPNSDASQEEIIKVRKNELMNVARYSSIHEVLFLDIPDRQTWKNDHRIFGFDVKKYEYIFVPNRLERHVDHKCLTYFFSKMIRKQHSKAKLFEYEVWTPIVQPDYCIDVSDFFARKLDLIKMYKSQLKCFDYVSFIEGLNRYRGAQNHSLYYEVFKEAKEPFRRRVISCVPTGVLLAVKKITYKIQGKTNKQ